MSAIYIDDTWRLRYVGTRELVQIDIRGWNLSQRIKAWIMRALDSIKRVECSHKVIYSKKAWLPPVCRRCGKIDKAIEQERGDL